MGVVYKARHGRLNRPAALKMVLGEARADSKGIIRFLAEAEAAAAVEHPHVVRVYDFGESDGRPFLALELCPGGSLADRLKAGRLAPTAAAGLVRKVADGVAAAHGLGIVHRDLKPANVLFDEHGEPKVADFGLAKRGAGADLTHSGAVLGTPAYMSPEQAQGGTKFVGPQADVWALGVILYECLTGARPFAADDAWALLRKVMSDDPPGVRTLARAVPRDLDLVCRKCLAKDPRNRYATAAELADDLGRFLAGRPITARPAGLAGRSWKWAKRNKPAVAVILALSALAGMAAWQAVRAHDEAVNARAAEQVALARKEQAQEVATFMREVFTQGSAYGQASPTRAVNQNLTVTEAMDYAVGAIGDRFEDRPGIEAAVRSTIGQTYHKLGKYAAAEPQLARALALREAALGPDHPDTLESVNDLALVYQAKGDYGTAEALFQRSLAGAEAALGPDHRDTLKYLSTLALLYQAKGDYRAAEPLLKRAVAQAEAVLGPDHPDTLTFINNLALLYETTANYAAAEPLYRRALAGKERALGPDHPSTLTTAGNLAILYEVTGDYAAAEPLYRRVLAGWEKALGPDNPETLTCANNMASMYFTKGDYGAAEPLYERALAGWEKALGPDHPHTLMSAGNLATVYFRTGRFAEAIPLYERAARGYAGRPERAGSLVAVRSRLGRALLATGKPADAEAHLLAAYKGLMKDKAPDAKHRARRRATAKGLVEVYEQTGRPAQAAEWRAKLAALPPETAPRPGK
jgi:tetratricopeptide (TPR) repeat protein/tRNA A-37 threonylcarbamoyl transferase component Bud32